MGLLYKQITEFNGADYTYHGYEADSMRRQCAQTLLKDFQSGLRCFVQGALNIRNYIEETFHTNAFVFHNNLRTVNVVNAIVDYMQPNSVLMVLDGSDAVKEELCFCGNCADDVSRMLPRYSAFRHACGTYNVLRSTRHAKDPRGRIIKLFAYCGDTTQYEAVQDFESCTQDIQVIGGTNLLSKPVIFYSGVQVDPKETYYGMRGLFKLKRPLETEEQTSKRVCNDTDVKLSQPSVAYDVVTYDSWDSFYVSRHYNDCEWIYEEFGKTWNVDLTEPNMQQEYVHNFYGFKYKNEDGEIITECNGIDVIALLTENGTVVGHRVFSKVRNLNRNLDGQTNGMKPCNLFSYTTRFNHTLVRDKRQGTYTILNKFTRHILQKHFPQTCTVIADLKTCNPHYLHSMQRNFVWDSNKETLRYACMPHLFWNRWQNLREQPWQRYRYYYLRERDVPYNEGQQLIRTCVWYLSLKQTSELSSVKIKGLSYHLGHSRWHKFK